MLKANMINHYLILNVESYYVFKSENCLNNSLEIVFRSFVSVSG